MADNLPLRNDDTNLIGTVATDDVSGVSFPRSKIALGNDGTFDGDICDARPMPTKAMVASPKKSYIKALSVAAGGQATLDSPQVSSGTIGKLLFARVGSSVAIKVSLYEVVDGVSSTDPVDEGYGWQGNYLWQTPHPDFVTATGNTNPGLDGFRAIVTNLDTSLPADVSMVMMWDEVTP